MGGSHAQGHKGKGVRVAVMDSGLPQTHPDLSNIAERTDWTEDGTEDDSVGHGTFVGGVIGGRNRECSGFAPEAELHSYRCASETARASPTLHSPLALNSARAVSS